MAPKKEAGAESTIRGTVTAAKWDDEDNVTGVMIVTEDDDEYYVDLKGTGKELLDLVDADVEITGAISKKGGTQQIAVKEYKEIELSDREDDEDEDEDYDEDYDEDEDEDYSDDDLDEDDEDLDDEEGDEEEEEEE